MKDYTAMMYSPHTLPPVAGQEKETSFYEETPFDSESDCRWTATDSFPVDFYTCIQQSLYVTRADVTDILEQSLPECQGSMNRLRPDEHELRPPAIVPTPDGNTGELLVNIAGYQYSIDPSMPMDTVFAPQQAYPSTRVSESSLHYSTPESTTGSNSYELMTCKDETFSPASSPHTYTSSRSCSSASFDSSLVETNDDWRSAYAGGSYDHGTANSMNVTGSYESQTYTDDVQISSKVSTTSSSLSPSPSRRNYDYDCTATTSHTSSYDQPCTSTDVYPGAPQHVLPSPYPRVATSSTYVNSPEPISTFGGYVWPSSSVCSFSEADIQIATETSATRRRKPSRRLWEFIRDLLLSPQTNPSLIRWENRDIGTFKLVQSKAIANMWGMKKGNDAMTYEKLSRAMRYYYKRQVFQPVIGKRLVYSFGPRATGWRE